MSTFWIIFGLITWYIIGVFSHIWWTTKERNYTLEDFWPTIGSGLLGPITWFLGWIILGDAIFVPTTIIFKKRKRK